MATENELAVDIAAVAIENLNWNFENGQLSRPDPEEMISEATSEYLDGNLIYTHDIIETWRELNCPEPESIASIAEAESIVQAMTWGILEAVGESQWIHDHVWDALDDRATEILTTKGEPVPDGLDAKLEALADLS